MIYSNPKALYQIGLVSDPSDGKMVHLYGLNLSRAWCFFHIAAKMPESKAKTVRDLAVEHIKYTFPHVVSGEYMGDHWLATFAVYALQEAKVN